MDMFDIVWLLVCLPMALAGLAIVNGWVKDAWTFPSRWRHKRNWRKKQYRGD